MLDTGGWKTEPKEKELRIFSRTTLRLFEKENACYMVTWLHHAGARLSEMCVCVCVCEENLRMN